MAFTHYVPGGSARPLAPWAAPGATFRATKGSAGVCSSVTGVVGPRTHRASPPRSPTASMVFASRVAGLRVRQGDSTTAGSGEAPDGLPEAPPAFVSSRGLLGDGNLEAGRTQAFDARKEEPILSREDSKTGPAVGSGAQAFGVLGVVAVFAALGGVYWDVAWHVVIGRESFWIPPHLLTYAGTAVFFLSVTCALLLTARRARSFRATGRAGAGFLVGLLGSLIQVSAAPLDDLWHRRYGLDVTVWSPPHLMGMAGALIGIYGLTCALGTGLPRDDERRSFLALPETNVLLLFAAALSLSMFALGSLDFRLESRDALFYPLLAAPLAAVPLVAAARYVGRFGAATAVALVYEAFRLLGLWIFVGMGAFENPGPPVFLVTAAFAVDLAFLGKKEDVRRVLGAAVIFGPAFVLGEWAVRVPLDVTNWQPLEVAASLTVVTLAAAFGVLAGDRLQSLMRSG